MPASSSQIAVLKYSPVGTSETQSTLQKKSNIDRKYVVCELGGAAMIPS